MYGNMDGYMTNRNLFSQVIFLLMLMVVPRWADASSRVDLSHFEHLEGEPIQEVNVTGYSVTQDFVIARELTIERGDTLDLTYLRQNIQRLDNLDIFSSISTEITQGTNGVAINLNVREIPFMLPYLTYDYTEQDGWSFGPSVKAANLLGRDIYLNGFAIFGGKNMFLFNVVNPWITGNHVSLDLTVSKTERDNELDRFQETSYEVWPWLGTFIGERGRARAGFGFFRMESDTTGHTLSPDQSDDMLQLGLALGYDSRDAWSNPHRGWWTELEFTQTGGFLGGDADFLTATFDVQRYQPVLWGQTLAIGKLLMLQTGEVGTDIPQYLDYHLGGSNSIRGYNVKTLGQTLYGKNQFISTVELRFTLMPSRELSLFGLSGDVGVAGAFFTDTGIAWNEPEEFARDRAKTGFGVGIRLLIPYVEMTRFDVGINTDGEVEFHFAAWSKMKAQRYRLR